MSENTIQLKATFFTFLVIGVLLLLFFLIKWENKIKKVDNIKFDYLEVNLGNVDESMGTEEILRKGEPGENTENSTTTQNNTTPTPVEETSKEIETTHSNNADEPAIKKNEEKKIIKPAKIIVPPIKKTVTIKSPSQTTTNVPVTKIEPKPKAVFKGFGAGQGNGSTSTNAAVNQGDGNIANGVQGKEYGKANTQNYGAGGTGTQLSMSNELKDRGIVNMPRFDAEFNQNAKIKIEISVDEAGNTKYIRTVNSNTTNPEFLKIIKQKLNSLKFRMDENESFGFIEFNFQLNE